MEILSQEKKQVSDILKIIGCSPQETAEHLKKIELFLWLDIAAEALVEYGVKAKREFKKEDAEAFVREHYAEVQIKEVSRLVKRDVIVAYVSKIMKDLPEETMAKVGGILDGFEMREE